MAVKSSFKNMTLCLLVICLVCSGLLAGVYALTKEPIAVAEKAKNDAAIKEVLPDGAVIMEKLTLEGNESIEYIKAMRADSTIVGYVVDVAPTGFGGPISMKVGFDNQGHVWNVKVLSHQETPGLGAKCAEKDFAVNYGYRGLGYSDYLEEKIKVTKDRGVINAITASTITSRAYAEGVAEAVQIIESIAKTPMLLHDDVIPSEESSVIPSEATTVIPSEATTVIPSEVEESK